MSFDACDACGGTDGGEPWHIGLDGVLCAECYRERRRNPRPPAYTPDVDLEP